MNLLRHFLSSAFALWIGLNSGPWVFWACY